MTVSHGTYSHRRFAFKLQGQVVSVLCELVASGKASYSRSFFLLSEITHPLLITYPTFAEHHLQLTFADLIKMGQKGKYPGDRKKKVSVDRHSV